MKFLSNKLDYLSLIAIVVFAISLSIMDFQDFSWAGNSKSYVGFLIFAILMIIKFTNNKNMSKTD